MHGGGIWVPPTYTVNNKYTYILLENSIYVYVLKILLQYSWNESHYKNLNRMSYFLCNAGSVGELHFLLLRACSTYT